MGIYIFQNLIAEDTKVSCTGKCHCWHQLITKGSTWLNIAPAAYQELSLYFRYEFTVV